MKYLTIFFLSFIISLVLTFFVRKIAILSNVVDKPNKERKLHEKVTPLLGGLAIFFAFFLSLSFFIKYIIAGDLNLNHWVGFFLGGLVLIIGGLLDDKYDLSPKYQFIFPFVAILIILSAGINIEKISNPVNGGFLYLDAWKIPLFNFAGNIFYFVVFSDLLIVIWLMGMMYTTKLLDGLDGLVSGVTMIGSFIIFLFTISDKFYQPDIAFASFALAAACLGFLIFNWHPASIFLGEGGSLFLGYALGVLAIISGGKFAIALLVMGIPILDVMWTIFRRLKEGKNPFKVSDRGHLHFRILDTGIGQRRTALLYYLISFAFGLSALFFQSMGKMLALSILILIMLLLVIIFNKQDTLKNNLNSNK